ncbi:hypothetical protein D3C86_1483850 [compost metagenome]
MARIVGDDRHARDLLHRLVHRGQGLVPDALRGQGRDGLRDFAGGERNFSDGRYLAGIVFTVQRVALHFDGSQQVGRRRGGWRLREALGLPGQEQDEGQQGFLALERGRAFRRRIPVGNRGLASTVHHMFS